MALVGSLSGSLGLVAVTGSFEPGVDNLYSIGTASKKWNTVVSTALSGSLTKLADGTSYIIAGSSIAVSTGSNGAITISTVGVGTGDVTGPASSTDNAIARFDQTTGKIIQNSAVTISDESANAVSIAGSATATTINLFNTDATTVNLAQAATTITAGASGGSTTFQGNLTGSNVLASTLTVTNGASFGGGFGNTGTSITSTGNISTDGNVIVGGDLTVNGTTTTISTTNLLVEDPIIYFGSGSVGSNNNGGIALASGSSVTDQALVWGRVANDTWGAGRLDVTNGTVTNLTTMSLLPVRASKFELGGATAFVTSSDGSNVTITHGSTSTTTFTKAGTPVVEIGDYAGSGEGQIKGVTTANALAPLWLSGSAVNIGSPSVTFLVNDQQQGTINPQTVGGGMRFEAQSGAGGSLGMVISGSLTKIGANTGVIQFEGGGVPFLTASAAGGAVNLTAGVGLTTANLFNTVSTTVSLGQAATTINMGNVAGTNNVAGATKFTQGLSGSLTNLTDGTSYLIAGTNISVTTGSNGAVTISTSGGGDVTGPASATDNAIARFDLTTGKIIQNSAVTISDETANAVTIAGSATATTISLFNTDATTVNFAQAATTLTAGASGGSTTFQGNLTGSNVLASTLTVTNGASFGGGFGSTGVSISGTGNISANGTLLIEGATTLSGSVILGDATGDDLTFNGYAASSLIPKTTNSYDLGTPDLRWRNMYTGDLHLKNERGDWTVIEEEEFLTLTNNKSGKRYKFVLEEI